MHIVIWTSNLIKYTCKNVHTKQGEPASQINNLGVMTEYLLHNFVIVIKLRLF